jgi:hypothetical protein
MLSSRYSFAEVVEMLQAHYDLLALHHAYMRDIQNDKISEDDVREYSREMFGFEIHSMQAFKEKVISDYLGIIEFRCRTFLTYIMAARKEEDIKSAISALYLMLEMEVKQASFDTRKASSEFPYAEKIVGELNQLEYLQSILKKLRKLLPAEYQGMTKYIFNEVERRRVPAGYQATIHITYALNLLNDELTAIAAKFHEYETKKAHKVRASAIPGWNEAFKNKCVERGLPDISVTFAMRYKTLADLIMRKITTFDDYNLKQQQLQEEKFEALAKAKKHDQLMHNSVVKNIQFYYSIAGCVDDIKHAYRDVLACEELAADLSQEVMHAKKYFGESRQKAAASIANLNSAFAAMFDKVSQDVQLMCELSVLDAQRAQFIGSSKLLNHPLNANYDRKFIRDEVLSIQQNVKFLAEAVENIGKKLNNIKQEEQEKQTVETPVNAAPIQQKPVEDEARIALLKQQQEANTEYRSAVEQRRADRSKAHTEDVPAAVQVQPQVAEPAADNGNADMKQRLLKMSPKKFMLLQDLFNPHKPVKYTKVSSLITKSLGGAVKEKNGSHNHIKIGGFFARSTGGVIAKPHTTQYDADIMGKVNRKLVVKTCIRAGITQEVIDEISKEREEIRKRC